MPKHSASAIAWIVTWLFAVLLAYASGGVIVPFLVATSRLRIRVTGCSVRLTGVDPVPMAGLGFALGVIPALLSAWSTSAAMGGSAAALVVWFGCRLRVHVTPVRTTVVRTVMYFLPWSWRSYRDPPRAFTDGWGDFADPLALYVEVGDEGRKLELGWGGKGTPDPDHLAAEFNEAVAAAASVRGPQCTPFRG
jgi:hypothetical protein